MNEASSGSKLRVLNPHLVLLSPIGPIPGLWTEDDLRAAFVHGAKWWEYEKTKFTMWSSDVRRAENEAERRYPNGKVRSKI